MSLTAAIALFWLHFIADFILQSDGVSRAKSSDNWVLAGHVLLYSLPFYAMAYWLPPRTIGVFLLVNVIAHFATDWITSRMTSRLWKAGEVHWFFVVIGADQAIHMTTLFATYWWLS